VKSSKLKPTVKIFGDLENVISIGPLSDSQSEADLPESFFSRLYFK
jgi:hypothetical protein